MAELGLEDEAYSNPNPNPNPHQVAELGLEDEAYFAPLADLEAFQRQLHADVGLSKVTLTVALTNPNPNPDPGR